MTAPADLGIAHTLSQAWLAKAEITPVLISALLNFFCLGCYVRQKERASGESPNEHL